jgi:hypothetical protein
LAAKLGCTRKQLLANIDAQELADWLILENITYWENRIKESTNDDEEHSQQMLTLMFSSHSKQG